jgi:hypothetical protein
MVWSNWQGTAWRGAAVVMLVWAGLAWTQTQGRPPATDGSERIMVVNGTTRCRVVESWQLTDARVAHLLQALDTGEMITIVDDQPPAPGVDRKPGAMPKRIFAWGVGQQTPPKDAPLPPHFRIDSGLVTRRETAPPTDATPVHGSAVINQMSEIPSIVTEPTPMVIVQHKEAGAMGHQGNGPIIDNRQPAANRSEVWSTRPRPEPSGMFVPNLAPPRFETMEVRPSIVPAVPTAMEPPTAEMPIVETPTVTKEPAKGAPMQTCDPAIICVPTQRMRPLNTWRPGDRLQAWLAGRPTQQARIVETPVVHARNPGMNEEFLIVENRVAQKRIEARVEKMYKAPFSTAMSTTPLPERKVDAPLAIPGFKPQEERMAPLPVPPVAYDKPLALPSSAEKREMWGNGQTAASQPPGKALLDSAIAPRRPDPLQTPEKLAPNLDRAGPKAGMLPPVGRDARMSPQAPEMNPPQGWPLGSQSALAARNGLQGPIAYLPVPTVTVPQPHHAPTPPAPKLPSPPELNAYVNAFSPPPAPKGAQQSPMMQSPAMPPFANPMLAQQMMQQQMMQQQMMMQQQVMHQQMMQQMLAQQQMMAQRMPYQQAPSTGPMSNVARHYTGPMPPNPVTSTYGPMPYPMMPTQAMMQQPMAPMVQPVGYQHPQQQAAAQQIEQVIKVLRESPYPAQREWASQTLVSFDWRVHPQIVPALLYSAAQDPAGNVRASCVCSLGRMQCAVEPVFGALHAMRNDIDPRVRQEVEHAFARLRQTPMMPQ